MARGNGRTINVKIPTQKVITALQQALAKLELDYTTQDQAEAKYQKAMDNIANAENLRTNYRQWNSMLNVDFDLNVKSNEFPVEPERELEPMSIHNYRDAKDEISNAIRILQLTDEETVSTSTYNSIAKYL